MIGSPHPEPGRVLTEIRDAAVEYVEHGWPIQPGTYWGDGSRRWHGKPHAKGLEPLAEQWTLAGIANPAHALNLWTHRPYSPVMACGVVADAIEIPSVRGAGVVQALRAAGCLPPTIVTPFGTWVLLVRPGEPSRPELALQLGVGFRRAGTWIALPPAAHATRCYRWHTHPRTLDWTVPGARRVQEVLIEHASTRRGPCLRSM